MQKEDRVSGVSTSYKQNGRKFESQICCSSLEQARLLVDVRNLSEVIESAFTHSLVPYYDFSKLSQEKFNADMLSILHQVEFLSFIALKSKTLCLEDVHGDYGIMHELIHYFQYNQGEVECLTCPNFEAIIQLLQGFYRSVKILGIEVR